MSMSKELYDKKLHCYQIVTSVWIAIAILVFVVSCLFIVNSVYSVGVFGFEGRPNVGEVWVSVIVILVFALFWGAMTLLIRLLIINLLKPEKHGKQIIDLEKKKSAITAREKQIKAKMSGEKRKKENHAKMVLGGAVFGVLKSSLPTDRRELDLYGRALKKVFENKQDALRQMIDTEYQRLKAAQPTTATLPEYDE